MCLIVVKRPYQSHIFLSCLAARCVGSSSKFVIASFTLPYSYALSFHCVLSAADTVVLGVLGHLEDLYSFP